MKSFKHVWISLPSEARNHLFPGPARCPSKNKRTKWERTYIDFACFPILLSLSIKYVYIKLDEIERTMMYISFISEPCDLKFGMLVVKTLLYVMNSAYYTYYTYILNFFFWCLKRVQVVFYLGQSWAPFFIYGILQFGPKTG